MQVRRPNCFEITRRWCCNWQNFITVCNITTRCARAHLRLIACSLNMLYIYIRLFACILWAHKCNRILYRYHPLALLLAYRLVFASPQCKKRPDESPILLSTLPFYVNIVSQATTRCIRRSTLIIMHVSFMREQQKWVHRLSSSSREAGLELSSAWILTGTRGLPGKGGQVRVKDNIMYWPNGPGLSSDALKHASWRAVVNEVC